MVLLVVLAVLVSACTLQPERANPDDSCSGQEGVLKDQCYLEQGKCSQIKNVALRDSCVAELAKSKKDLSVCNLIVGAKTQAYCHEQIAVLTNNVGMCENITDSYWQNNCMYALAVKNNDAGRCAYVSVVSQQIDCVEKVALATNNHLLCERLGEERNERCLLTIATSLKDKSICEKMGTSFNQNNCVLYLAKKLNRQGLCSEITFRPMKESCDNHFRKT